MNPIEQQFFNDLEKKLWTSADKLRSKNVGQDRSLHLRNEVTSTFVELGK